jgi:hypothetical protein
MAKKFRKSEKFANMPNNFEKFEKVPKIFWKFKKKN